MSNGVWLETQIKDSRGEVFSTATNNASLSHYLEIAWRYNWRSADIKVTHDIIQGGNIIQYVTNGQLKWTAPFARVKYGQPNRNASERVSVGSQTGQVIIDCTTVEVFDIWKNRYVPVPGGVQLTLQVT